jgi:hypothetical protein
VADDSTTIALGRSELREVTGYAVACARPALVIFERERPDDRRTRTAIDAAQAFADGGERTKALRDSAWAAHRAAQEARDAGQAAASDAARAAAATRSVRRTSTPAKSYSRQADPRTGRIGRTSVRTLRRRRSRRRTRPNRAVPDPCASRRSGGPGALPERTAWWWTCRGADSNARRIAATIGDRPIIDLSAEPLRRAVSRPIRRRAAIAGVADRRLR